MNLLARGWYLADEGRLIPYGNPGSGGGVAPGPATSVLVGLPLLVWRDPRAPVVLILAFHFLAFLLLDRVVRQCLCRRERLLFALLYGLSPTRLYFSGFLWNPSYLFLAGAVHMWTAYRQRGEARFLDSFLHVLVVGLAFQVHASTIILAFASLALFLRGGMKLHWPGAIAGAVAAGLTLVPYLEAIQQDPTLIPVGVGFPFRGLVFVFPLVRGLLNWLRYSSLSVSKEVTRFDLSGPLGEGVDAWLSPLLKGLALTAGVVTMIAALAAAVWFYRRLRQGHPPWRFAPGAPQREWLEGYVLWCFVAAFVTFCIAPTTPMWWQVVSVTHAAVLPLVLWGAELSAGRWQKAVRRAAWAWGAASIALVVVTALASPQFRCGGRYNVVLDLVSDHPMFDGLGLRERCWFEVNDPDGWWPDALPREPIHGPWACLGGDPQRHRRVGERNVE